MRPGGRRVHSGSLISFVCALRVVGFILCRWVRTGGPWGYPGSFLVDGFIRVRPGDRRVHLGSLGIFGCALWVVGFTMGR